MVRRNNFNKDSLLIRGSSTAAVHSPLWVAMHSSIRTERGIMRDAPRRSVRIKYLAELEAFLLGELVDQRLFATQV